MLKLVDVFSDGFYSIKGTNGPELLALICEVVRLVKKCLLSRMWLRIVLTEHSLDSEMQSTVEQHKK